MFEQTLKYENYNKDLKKTIEMAQLEKMGLILTLLCSWFTLHLIVDSFYKNLHLQKLTSN